MSFTPDSKGRPDGSGFRLLTFGPNAGPQPYGELFVMREDGSEVTQLTDNQSEDATPTWQPVQLSTSTVMKQQNHAAATH